MMGQGYKARPQGLAKVAANIRDLQRDQARTRTAANIQNSAITGGSGLTVGDPTGGAQLHLFANPGGGSPFGSLEFYNPTSPTRTGDLSCDGSTSMALQSPVDPATDNFATVPASVILTSGDNGSVGALVQISAASANSAILVAGAGVIATSSGSSAAHATVGGFDFFQDATSARIMGNASLVFPASTAEVRCRDFADSAYVPIRASAFTVTSTREAKQCIADLDWAAVEVVANAKARQYRYRVGHASSDRVHFGPMVEDLPDELVDVSDPDAPAVNAMDLIGVLWGAVGEQQALIVNLMTRVKDLEKQIGQHVAG